MRSRLPIFAAIAVVLAAALLAVYWYFEPASRPGWVAERMPTDPAAQVTMYRWKDEAGQWVLSDEPPPAGVDYETVTVRYDTNVVPPLVDPDKDE